MRNLQGAIALVTGASSGIGYAAARSLARRGAHVVLTARRADRLRALAAEIGRMDAGAETLVLPADLNAEGECGRVAREAAAWKGRVDILVNNAGFGRLLPLEELDPAGEILAQIRLDLVAPILLARALLPGMIARRSGCILNVGSVASLTAMPTFTVYSAAKYGLRGFNDALRREAREFGIDVCLICPGPVRTEFGLHSRRRRGWEDSVTERTTVEAEVLGELVAKTAERPRRCVVIPWYYRLAVAFCDAFPGLADFLVDRLYARPLRRNSAERPADTGDPTGRRV
jgi:short-subunit dehydrogenase